jgi:hypothetical protein
VNRQKIYEKALERWGELSQILVAIEEMAELQKELCKLDRCHDKNSKEVQLSCIADEMADVEIMLEQLKFIYSNNQEVEERKLYKLERLKKVLELGRD